MWDFTFSILVFIKHVQQKIMDSLTLERHNSFQNKNNRKVTYIFATRFLIFKLQQGV